MNYQQHSENDIYFNHPIDQRINQPIDQHTTQHNKQHNNQHVNQHNNYTNNHHTKKNTPYNQPIHTYTYPQPEFDYKTQQPSYSNQENVNNQTYLNHNNLNQTYYNQNYSDQTYSNSNQNYSNYAYQNQQTLADHLSFNNHSLNTNHSNNYQQNNTQNQNHHKTTDNYQNYNKNQTDTFVQSSSNSYNSYAFDQSQQNQNTFNESFNNSSTNNNSYQNSYQNNNSYQNVYQNNNSNAFDQNYTKTQFIQNDQSVYGEIINKSPVQTEIINSTFQFNSNNIQQQQPQNNYYQNETTLSNNQNQNNISNEYNYGYSNQSNHEITSIPPNTKTIFEPTNLQTNNYEENYMIDHHFTNNSQSFSLNLDSSIIGLNQYPQKVQETNQVGFFDDKSTKLGTCSPIIATNLRDNYLNNVYTNDNHNNTAKEEPSTILPDGCWDFTIDDNISYMDSHETNSTVLIAAENEKTLYNSKPFIENADLQLNSNNDKFEMELTDFVNVDDFKETKKIKTNIKETLSANIPVPDLDEIDQLFDGGLNFQKEPINEKDVSNFLDYNTTITENNINYESHNNNNNLYNNNDTSNTLNMQYDYKRDENIQNYDQKLYNETLPLNNLTDQFHQNNYTVCYEEPNNNYIYQSNAEVYFI